MDGNVFTAWNRARAPLRIGAGLVVLLSSLAHGQAASHPASEPAETPTSYLTLQSDPENCLSCHRFRGLSRLEPKTGELRLFFCNVDYFANREGPHSRLRCTSCHRSSEVMVIPHHVETRVDCTQTCHIVPSSGVEMRFSHASVAESLGSSAHSPEKLGKLVFDPPLLREGQSTCLYCHDQPSYRSLKEVTRAVGQGEATARCRTCHGEDLPIDVDYYAGHVSDRLRPERPIRQLAQVCAVCHSDPKILAQINQHDTVASYLHSFHGKANLLGSSRTAICVDCHASETGNIHEIRGKTDPLSSTNQAQLPTTCRTTQCHPGAPPGMSQAAVHLNLDPHARSPEFYVAAMFVALTAGTMVVFLFLVILEVLHILATRPSAEARRHVALARKVMEHSEGHKALIRMTPHQRVQHWMLVVTFVLLVLTGMPIKFANAPWASWLTNLLGGLTITRNIHRVSGVLLMVAFVYHLGYLAVAFVERVRQARAAGNRDPLWKFAINSPMFVSLPDIRMFGQLFGFLLFLRKHRPHFGHFNVLQKFEYWAVFWGIPVMGLSGLALWGSAGISEYVSGRILNFAFIIHSDEAYLAFTYIAVVHMFSVILAPAVFPLSTGTLTGEVPPEEIAEAHLGQLEETARRLNINVDDLPPARWTFAGAIKDLGVRFYALILLAGFAGVGYLSMNFLFHLILERQTAPVEIVEIPKRLDAETLIASALARGQVETNQSRPRGPLAHFHTIPNWFQVDPGNSCTTSGCHGPLPHGNRIEVRAFLNMHTTFVDCTVCHAENSGKSSRPVWLDLPGRQTRAIPAVLQLTELLDTHPTIAPEDVPDINAKLIALLAEAVKESGGNAQLKEWHLRLETAYPKSKPWQKTIDAIRRGIRTHVHGEYNAKIALLDGDKPVGAFTADQQQAAREFLDNGAKLSVEQKQALIAKLHSGVKKEGTLCAPCHTPESTLIDFAKLGYPDSRAQSLKSSQIVRQVLLIEKGQPFYLPRIAEERHENR